MFSWFLVLLIVWRGTFGGRTPKTSGRAGSSIGTRKERTWAAQTRGDIELWHVWSLDRCGMMWLKSQKDIYVNLVSGFCGFCLNCFAAKTSLWLHFRFWEELERVRLEQARQQAIREKLKQISPCPAGFNWYLGRTDASDTYLIRSNSKTSKIVLTGSILMSSCRFIPLDVCFVERRVCCTCWSLRLFWGTRPRVDGAVAVVHISSPMSSADLGWLLF